MLPARKRQKSRKRSSKPHEKTYTKDRSVCLAERSFLLFTIADLTFDGVLHIIRLHLRFSAVCVISRKEICQTVLKFFGHKNSAGSASTEGCEPLQMTRKKSSKFSADASCPISAGDTGSLIKQRGYAQTEGRAMHKYFCKGKTEYVWNCWLRWR